MDDLEITKLCAEAMGFKVERDMQTCCHCSSDDGRAVFFYDPLHDDAQAMALVKEFKIGIDCGRDGGDMSAASLVVNGVMYVRHAEDLNRAICECVAKMQQEKNG